MLVPNKTRYENNILVCEKMMPDGLKANKYVSSWIPKGANMKPGGKMIPIGITIHNTGDLKNVDRDAEQYTRATYNGNMSGAVVHYYVDDVEVWQLLRENEPGWHASDGSGDGNKRTIAVECIMNGSGSKEDLKSRDNAARLIAAIMIRYNWNPDENLYTHNHWMGLPDKIVPGAKKNCPLYLLPKYQEFKDLIFSYMKSPQVNHTSYLVRVTAAGLNIRQSPNASSKIMGVITDKGVYTIVDEDNGWGLLKSYRDKRNGWIKLSYTKKL